MRKLLPIKLNFLSALAFLLLSSVAFGQNLVKNGSFELSNPLVTDLSVAGSFITLNTTNTLTDWTHTGVVDVHNARHWAMGCPAGGDTQHMDVNLTGALTQTVTGLATGGTYRLSFYTSVHAQMNCGGTSSATVAFGSMISQMISRTSANKAWTLHTFTFTATSTSAVLTISSNGSCYGSGGVLFDLVSITPECDMACQDHDWYEVGTTLSPMSNTVKAYRIGDALIGTNNPYYWNYKLVIDNRNDIYEQNNNRNAIHATAMHTQCSYGYGILVNTNRVSGTKAFAAQGDGIDRAVIFGNGKSWFSNIMTLGGNPPANACEDLPSIHILTINGTGLINGMNLTSDSRFKTDVKPIEKTNEIINKLNPVIYKFKTEEFKHRNFPEGNTYGFIAQELKEVLPYTVTEETDGYLSVNYIAIIPVLTQAIKEQQEKIEKLEEKMAVMEGINKQQGTLEGSTEPQKVEINKTAMLMQNNPNPLSDVTFIDYYLPATTVSAFIKVTDNNGRLIQAFPIEKTGYGQLELNCLNMATGTYYYSLIVDNNVIATKTMLIAKN
jgi:hypothetical protein